MLIVFFSTRPKDVDVHVKMTGCFIPIDQEKQSIYISYKQENIALILTHERRK